VPCTSHGVKQNRLEVKLPDHSLEKCWDRQALTSARQCPPLSFCGPASIISPDDLNPREATGQYYILAQGSVSEKKVNPENEGADSWGLPSKTSLYSEARSVGHQDRSIWEKEGVCRLSFS
jgi:hypothetical protein